MAKLTIAHVGLTRQVTDAETRNKKPRRSSRNEEGVFRPQLATVQCRRD